MFKFPVFLKYITKVRFLDKTLNIFLIDLYFARRLHLFFCPNKDKVANYNVIFFIILYIINNKVKNDFTIHSLC